MTDDFLFEELGTRAFEQLGVALAVGVFGPDVEIYGSGSDGGREAVFTKPFKWSSTDEDDSDTWTGRSVVQVKQCEHIRRPKEYLAWLKLQIRDELNDWVDKPSRAKLFPNNLLFITNARLSATPGGGVDQIQQFAETELDREHGSAHRPKSARSRGLRSIKVWHRDKLNALVRNNQSVRFAFPTILTIGDIISKISAFANNQLEPAQFGPLLIEHAQTSLRYDRWVRFGEAGGSSRQSIEKVVINLPAAGTRMRSPVLDECIFRGNYVLRKSTWGLARQRHLVITGAPGNGKSTITSYLTQLYRSAFIASDSNSPSISELLKDTATSMERLKLPGIRSRRWPLRIDLAEMAAAMGPTGGPSAIRWMCGQISERLPRPINPSDLQTWINSWPTVLLFDGLDEVTSPALRSRVIDEITELVDDFDTNDSDVLVIVTTRPTGYTEQLLPKHFSQIDLDYLTLDEAINYGTHITSQRLHDDDYQQKRLLARFRKAATDAATERLLKTPLQVLILTFILEGMGELPANRYELFWGYFDTVFRREADKTTTFQNFLREHRDDITEIHQRVGLRLQIQCEGTDEIRSRLSRADLNLLAWKRMVEVGHDSEIAARDLADRLLEVATQRLVLLVADENDTVSFEVRSLQELMAARALVAGDDETIRNNLQLAAPSPHWRNTWLFAAGKLFSESDHRRKLVMDIITSYDDCGLWPSWLYPVGPELSAHMLDDGISTTKPAAQRTLADVALRSFNGPMPLEPKSIGRSLTIALESKSISARIRNAFKDAFAGTPTAKAIALDVWHQGEFGPPVPGFPFGFDTTQNRWLRPANKGRRVTVKQLLLPHFEELCDGEIIPGSELVREALEECGELVLRRATDGELLPGRERSAWNCEAINRAVWDTDAAGILDLCLGALAPLDWAARSVVARAFWNANSRRAVGHELDTPDLDEELPPRPSSS